jgi:hypothetical protein
MTGCGFMPFSGKNQTRTQNSSQKTLPANPRELAKPALPADGFQTDPLPPLKQDINFDPLATTKPLEARPGGSLGVLGLNLDTYFSGNMEDPIARIERVERAVSAMNRDMKTIAQPIQRLVAIESDIQELVGQLESLLENEPAPMAGSNPASSNSSMYSQELASTGPPTAIAPPMQKQYTPPAPAAKTWPADSGGSKVLDVRLGEHKDKTRIVFDVTGKANMRFDIDNAENLLVVELPGTGWSTAMSKANLKSPLIAAYSVQPTADNGSRIIIQLKHPANVIYNGTYPPNGNKKHRLVLDLRSTSVHK